MHSLARLWIVGLVLLGGSSQSTGLANKTAAQEAFEGDRTELAIDSERYYAFIERSNEGLNYAERARDQSLDDDSRWRLRADRAQKEAALRLVMLRNRLLQLKLVSARDVETIVWPAWIFEPPTAFESPDTLAHRLDWLATEAEKMIEIGCELGREKTDNYQFCSIE